MSSDDNGTGQGPSTPRDAAAMPVLKAVQHVDRMTGPSWLLNHVVNVLASELNLSEKEARAEVRKVEKDGYILLHKPPQGQPADTRVSFTLEGKQLLDRLSRDE